MEVDCLGYFHDVPPLIEFADENGLKKLYIMGSKSGEATADLVRNSLHQTFLEMVSYYQCSPQSMARFCPNSGATSSCRLTFRCLIKLLVVKEFFRAIIGR
jgi:hypothetical protein